MSIKTLAAGLGACAIFLAGSWHPGNADASFTHDFATKTTSLEQAESGAHLNRGFPSLLLANQRNSNFRANNTRKKRGNHRPSYQTNRQNNPRFIQRTRRSNFSTPNLRSHSNRERQINRRHSVRINNIRNNRNIYKRPNAQKFEFITPQ